MILYKYRNISDSKCFEYTLDSLKNNYLYFSRPSELNDPFDCRMKVDFKATDEEYKAFIDNKITNPKGQFSNIEELKKFLVENNKNKKQLIDMLSSQNHVLSLTSDCLNEQMWGLYGGAYTGICIGYNCVEENGIPKVHFIKYSQNSINMENCSSRNCDDYIPFKKIMYDNEGRFEISPFGDLKKQNEILSYYLVHKKKCWESENEYRAICVDNPLIKTDDLFETKIFYPYDTLAEIIFGYNVDADKARIIYEILKTQNKTVNFYRVKPDYDEYKLIKEPIIFNY